MSQDIVCRCEAILAEIKIGNAAARKEMSELFPELQGVADAGRADAQALVGGLALEYIDNADAAAHYFRMAAEAGDPAGQRGLGHMMANGIAMEQDLVEAARLFSAAAESGDPIAAFNLGSMYLKGIGTAPDETRAVELLRRAEAGGVPAAAALLADWHAERREYTEARRLYVAAANGGILCFPS
ncbi:MAG: tetratricopeptide repeat protein [Actinoallomurus sp.]